MVDLETPTARATIESDGSSGGVWRYLTFVGLAFLALMITLEPDVGFVAPPAARLLFWTLQIVTGLWVLQSVLYMLTRRYGASRVPSWSLVLVSGIVGAALLAPAYWLIGEGLMEGWLGYPESVDEDGSDFFGITSGNPLLNEYVHIVGPVTTAWMLICLPRLNWLVPPLLRAPTQPTLVTSLPLVESADRNAMVETRVVCPPSTRDVAGEPSPQYDEFCATGTVATCTPPLRVGWLSRLPSELGTDVIAVTSELQYLRVWTSRGCALILGALADVESEGAGYGLRVHRSWWVACQHVVSVRRTATGAICLMSDGQEVPVSRRRRAEVLARFGDGAQYRVGGASKPIAETDLH